MKIILFIVLLAVKIEANKCPFLSCQFSYSSSLGCRIVCSNLTFPERGNSSETIIALIQFNNLADDIPDDAFAQLNISDFNLFSNNFKNLRKNSFRGLKSITKLNIRAKNLTTVEKGSFEYLNSMQILIITNSSLTSKRLESLGLIEEINSLSKLRVLDLKFNEIEAIKETYFQNMNLQSLYMPFNNISEIRFTQMNSLIELDLDFNLIDVPITPATFKMPNLRYLYMENNLIRTLNLSNMDNLLEIDLLGNRVSIMNVSNLAKLEILNLDNNLLTDIDPGDLYNVNKLERLILSNNYISNFAIARMPSLKTLELDDNFLVKVVPDMFDEMPVLESLNLYNNLIEEVSFADMTTLRFLDIEHNYIEYIDSQTFLNLRNLEQLYLNNNSLLNFEFTSDLILLKKLDMRFNKLNSIISKAFQELINLEYLDLSNNEIRIVKDMFEQNKMLRTIFLEYNYLKSIPSVANIASLVEVDFSRQITSKNFTSLPDFAFERKIESDPDMSGQIYFYLDGNNITRFGSRLFCSRFADKLVYGMFNLWIDSIDTMDKCILKQLTPEYSTIRITSRNCTDCKIKLFAIKLSIAIDDDCDIEKCKDIETPIDDCHLKQEFICPSIQPMSTTKNITIIAITSTTSSTSSISSNVYTTSTLSATITTPRTNLTYTTTTLSLIHSTKTNIGVLTFRSSVFCLNIVYIFLNFLYMY
jgi:Leucine-rich repeat (LRR) protein